MYLLYQIAQVIVLVQLHIKNGCRNVRVTNYNPWNNQIQENETTDA